VLTAFAARTLPPTGTTGSRSIPFKTRSPPLPSLAHGRFAIGGRENASYGHVPGRIHHWSTREVIDANPPPGPLTGYEEIGARAASVYEHCVGAEGLSFRGRDDAERLADVVKFHWEAVAKNGEVFAVGLSFLVVAANGRIERDYTFVVA
jgi:hypothetical protein